MDISEMTLFQFNKITVWLDIYISIIQNNMLVYCLIYLSREGCMQMDLLINHITQNGIFHWVSFIILGWSIFITRGYWLQIEAT